MADIRNFDDIKNMTDDQFDQFNYVNYKFIKTEPESEIGYIINEHRKTLYIPPADEMQEIRDKTRRVNDQFYKTAAVPLICTLTNSINPTNPNINSPLEINTTNLNINSPLEINTTNPNINSPLEINNTTYNIHINRLKPFTIDEIELNHIPLLKNCVKDTDDDYNIPILTRIPVTESIFNLLLNYIKIYKYGAKYPVSKKKNKINEIDRIYNNPHEAYLCRLSNYQYQYKYVYSEHAPHLSFYLKPNNDLNDQEEEILNSLKQTKVQYARDLMCAYQLADYMQLNEFKGFIHKAVYNFVFHRNNRHKMFNLIYTPTPLYKACFENVLNANLYYNVFNYRMIDKGGAFPSLTNPPL